MKELTKDEARKLTTELRDRVRQNVKDWFALGRDAEKLVARGVHRALGKNQKEWMRDVFGASETKMMRALKVTRALKCLPEKKVEELITASEGNAYQLSRLPEKMRKDPVWSERAITAGNEEFQKEVEHVLEGKGIKREIFVPLKGLVDGASLRLPKELAELWEEAIDSCADALDLDLKEKPGRRIMVYESIARLLLDASQEELRTQLPRPQGTPDAS